MNELTLKFLEEFKRLKKNPHRDIRIEDSALMMAVIEAYKLSLPKRTRRPKNEIPKSE